MGVLAEKLLAGPARLAAWAPNMDVVAMVSAEGCGAGVAQQRRALRCVLTVFGRAQAAVRISPQLAAPVGPDVRRPCAHGAAARACHALTSARGRSRQSAGARTASSLQQALQARVPVCDAHAQRRSRCTTATTRRRLHLLPRRRERGGACSRARSRHGIALRSSKPPASV